MKNKRGFTIIELVVVIAVIGILVFLALPEFSNKTEETEVVRAKNDMKVVDNKITEMVVSSSTKGIDTEKLIEDITLEVVPRGAIESLIDYKIAYDTSGLLTFSDLYDKYYTDEVLKITELDWYSDYIFHLTAEEGYDLDKLYEYYDTIGVIYLNFLHEEELAILDNKSLGVNVPGFFMYDLSLGQLFYSPIPYDKIGDWFYNYEQTLDDEENDEYYYGYDEKYEIYNH